jgi:hypothetical protein
MPETVAAPSTQQTSPRLRRQIGVTSGFYSRRASCSPRRRNRRSVARGNNSRKLAGISWCRLALVLPFRSREFSGSDMTPSTPSRNLTHETRYWWFESALLQRRVYKLSVLLVVVGRHRLVCATQKRKLVAMSARRGSPRARPELSAGAKIRARRQPRKRVPLVAS